MPARGLKPLRKADIMRSDMHKVIIERPRPGSSWLPAKKTALRLRSVEVANAAAEPDAYDSGPRRASARRYDKSLNENLAPLARYLHRQVNRPWTAVYGEIRQTIDTRSAIGMHVLQHLEDFVTLHTAIRDGKVVGLRRWRDLAPVEGLYVHPVTGLLRLAKPPRRPRPAAREANLVRVSQTLEFEKIDGCWFRLEYRLPDPAENPKEPRALALKRQCDRKTVRRIEAGEFGPLTRKR
jgi:hypothetical protein